MHNKEDVFRFDQNLNANTISRHLYVSRHLTEYFSHCVDIFCQ
jgi:hypothetical protein